MVVAHLSPISEMGSRHVTLDNTGMSASATTAVAEHDIMRDPLRVLTSKLPQLRAVWEPVDQSGFGRFVMLVLRLGALAPYGGSGPCLAYALLLFLGALQFSSQLDYSVKEEQMVLKGYLTFNQMQLELHLTATTLEKALSVLARLAKGSQRFTLVHGSDKLHDTYVRTDPTAPAAPIWENAFLLCKLKMTVH